MEYKGVLYHSLTFLVCWNFSELNEKVKQTVIRRLSPGSCVLSPSLHSSHSIGDFLMRRPAFHLIPLFSNRV